MLNHSKFEESLKIKLVMKCQAQVSMNPHKINRKIEWYHIKWALQEDKILFKKKESIHQVQANMNLQENKQDQM